MTMASDATEAEARPSERNARDARAHLHAAASSSLADGSFRLLAETLPLSVFITTDDGAVTYLNPHAVGYAGLPSAAPAAWAWAAWVHPDDVPGLLAFWSGSSAFETTIGLRRADGTYRPHVLCASPCREGAHGRLQAWFARAARSTSARGAPSSCSASPICSRP